MHCLHAHLNFCFIFRLIIALTSPEKDAMEHHIFQLPDCDENACGLDMDLIVMTLAEVSAAMDFLHLHRITHRDLKPKNVLLKTSRKDRRGFIAKASLVNRL